MGGSERHRTQMRAFQQALEDCSLSDLGYSSPKFTWQNCQEGDCFVKERLDRGVANNAWRSLFPDAEIIVTSTIFSDHAPIFLTLTRGRGVQRRSRGFRFQSSWAMEKKLPKLGSRNLEQGKGAWEQVGQLALKVTCMCPRAYYMATGNKRRCTTADFRGKKSPACHAEPG
jgi:hypothetical protein